MLSVPAPSTAVCASDHGTADLLPKGPEAVSVLGTPTQAFPVSFSIPARCSEEGEVVHNKIQRKFTDRNQEPWGNPMGKRKLMYKPQSCLGLPREQKPKGKQLPNSFNVRRPYPGASWEAGLSWTLGQPYVFYLSWGNHKRLDITFFNLVFKMFLAIH